MNIREERKDDFRAIKELIIKAFKEDENSDHNEQFLVAKLRKSDAYIPELAIVAEDEEIITGYVMLSKIKIENKFISLALAPIVVHPKYQNRGVGAALIKEVHQRAFDLGYESVILLGHPEYYQKFGYRKLSDFDIKLPFDVPEDFCMAIELKQDALMNVKGTVVYSDPFYE